MPVEPMSAERLAEIDGRFAGTSEGEWLYFPEDSSVCAMDGVIPCEVADLSNNSADEPQGDGEFIAHAHQDVPDLLAEVKRLKAVEAELRELLGCFGVDDSGWQSREPLIDYFDAQVDKVDWVRIQAVLGKGEVK